MVTMPQIQTIKRNFSRLFFSIIPFVYAKPDPGPSDIPSDNELVITPQGQFSNLSNITIPGIVSTAITLLVIVVALVFFFMLVSGGIKWITANGDEKNVATARSTITNALIGLVIVFSAWAIINLIGVIFGINIFNFAIPTL